MMTSLILTDVVSRKHFKRMVKIRHVILWPKRLTIKARDYAASSFHNTRRVISSPPQKPWITPCLALLTINGSHSTTKPLMGSRIISFLMDPLVRPTATISWPQKAAYQNPPEGGLGHPREPRPLSSTPTPTISEPWCNNSRVVLARPFPLEITKKDRST